jgi:rubrerythrin
MKQTMAELKGSKTEQNLWTAFAGESQARNKYTYFASKANVALQTSCEKFSYNLQKRNGA